MEDAKILERTLKYTACTFGIMAIVGTINRDGMSAFLCLVLAYLAMQGALAVKDKIKEL